MQPPTWKGLLSAAAEPKMEVAVAATDFGSQEVGLRVKLERPSLTAAERRSSGMPSRIEGKGSLTVRTRAVSGLM